MTQCRVHCCPISVAGSQISDGGVLMQAQLLVEETERSRLQAALQRERAAAEETVREQAARDAAQAQDLSAALTEAELQVIIRNTSCATV